jgi:hypothetical protein
VKVSVGMILKDWSLESGEWYCIGCSYYRRVLSDNDVRRNIQNRMAICVPGGTGTKRGGLLVGERKSGGRSFASRALRFGVDMISSYLLLSAAETGKFSSDDSC